MKYEEALEYAKGGLEVYLRAYPELTTQIEFQKLSIEALEKQTPKKPVKVEKDWGHIMFIDACPRCKITAPYSNFCPFCGQAIDWSEE